jgi:hypothetical protein
MITASIIRNNISLTRYLYDSSPVIKAQQQKTFRYYENKEEDVLRF